MTMDQYPRSLQTVLDDTLGSHRVAESFEKEPIFEFDKEIKTFKGTSSDGSRVRGERVGSLNGELKKSS